MSFKHPTPNPSFPTSEAKLNADRESSIKSVQALLAHLYWTPAVLIHYVHRGGDERFLKRANKLYRMVFYRDFPAINLPVSNVGARPCFMAKVLIGVTRSTNFRALRRKSLSGLMSLLTIEFILSTPKKRVWISSERREA